MLLPNIIVSACVSQLLKAHRRGPHSQHPSSNPAKLRVSGKASYASMGQHTYTILASKQASDPAWPTPNQILFPKEPMPVGKQGHESTYTPFTGKMAAAAA